jgi:formylglycine-generating enzyme required for sulfatase activity
VSNFRLDRFEVTVGRFRKFTAAWDSGFRPSVGAGKHSHLNGGQGLAASAGGYESGWNASWAASLPVTASNWDAKLWTDHQLNDLVSTWTSAPGANENLPLSWTAWTAAMAFCIWDGGFLPSESEWNYAATGGAEQRVYPWSNPPSSTTLDCLHVNSLAGIPCVGKPNIVGSESPLGDGKYGQADLAGNLSEWALDYSGGIYPSNCDDCFASTLPGGRRTRGGSYTDPNGLPASSQSSGPEADYTPLIGIRCARSP